MKPTPPKTATLALLPSHNTDRTTSKTVRSKTQPKTEKQQH